MDIDSVRLTSPHLAPVGRARTKRDRTASNCAISSTTVVAAADESIFGPADKPEQRTPTTMRTLGLIVIFIRQMTANTKKKE